MGSTHGNDLTIKQQPIAAAAYNSNNTILYIRPLTIPNPNPNPLHNPSTATFYSTISPHNTLSLNTNHVSIRHTDDDGDRKAECMEQPMSSRWNPTPEQLLALEEMYRRGVRTPTADHIQHIATELRRFGKIEGKNVFYWFQNHKARERQKRRRELTDLGNGNGNGNGNSKQREHLTEENSDKKESGLRKTGYDVEQTKNFWIPSSDCNKLSEETNTSSETGPQDNEWTKFDEKTKEFQQGESTLINPSVATKDARWHPLELLPSYCPCSTPKLILNNNSLMAENYRSETDQTLELFPLRCNEDDNNNNNNYPNITAINPTVRTNTIFEDNTNSFTPTQYFEFLPLKN